MTAVTIDRETGEVLDDNEAKALTKLATTLTQTAALAPTPEAARKAMETYQEISQALIDEREDIQTITTRRGDRKFPKRSAFAKLANAYRVSTEIVRENFDYDDDGKLLRYRVIVRATHPDGRYAEADGACSRTEERFARGDQSRIDHDLPATAVTRAKNRAISDLVAFGAVSAEEAETSGEPAGPGKAAAERTLPAWAAPVQDIGGVAHGVHELLVLGGVPEADRGDAVTRIGQKIFDSAAGSIPLVIAQVVSWLAEELRTARAADTPAGRTADAMAEDFAQVGEDEPAAPSAPHAEMDQAATDAADRDNH
jgi:hypothetical protein